MEKVYYINSSKTEVLMTEPNEQGVPIEFISSSGQKVIVTNDPSQRACEQFVRVLLDIKARHGIKK